MAVFAIERTPKGLTAFVDGADVGREVDAAKFNTPTSFGKEVTGLSQTFCQAVNDAQANAKDITTPVVDQKFTAVKPQSYNA